MHNSSALPDGMVLVSSESDANTFHAEDREDARFYIRGVLDTGRLTFTVVAVVGGRRGPNNLTGRQFFDALMAHIGRRRVKVIGAQWTSYPEELSANLDIFNDATRRNTSTGDGEERRAEAVFETFTGRWAKDYHFRVVQDLVVRPEGTPGAYEEVTVDFVRPPRKKS